MDKDTNTKQTETSKQNLSILREGVWIGFTALALFLLITLFSYDPADPAWSRTGGNHEVANAAGKTGAWLADVLFFLFGNLAYFFPFLLGLRTVLMIFGKNSKSKEQEPVWHRKVLLRVLGFILIIVSGASLVFLSGQVVSSLPQSAGGLLGNTFGGLISQALGLIGARLILIALLFFGITLFTNLSWLDLFDRVGALCVRFIERTAASLKDKKAQHQEKQEMQKHVHRRERAVAAEKVSKAKRKPITISSSKPSVVNVSEANKDVQEELFIHDKKDAQRLPSIELLDVMEDADRMGFSAASLEAMSRLLELKLKDFGVLAEVMAVLPGPVVTRFEIQPAPGVKASKITGLAKDLARSLAVMSVRVVEVIAGKSVVGIEVPNENREMVRLSQVLASVPYQESKSPLTIALGHDISGQAVISDLARMPHLLVAGTTGSGKSVGVNAMLLSLLYKSTPDDVRLLLVDPKMLELAIYEGIPHLLSPVITDMKDAANGLRWCVGEMERRYKLMSKLGVRNLAGFNKKVHDANAAGEPISDPIWLPEPLEQMMFEEQGGEGLPPPPHLESLPAIVVVIDEFADMMMIVGKKVEQLIARIAQKARAAGIHLVLATQRPSVDVITGLIKANIPTRMAFQVSSRIDSRTILDQGGAEQLLGHGDMLFLPSGTSVPIRVHGAFVDDHEVHKVVEDWRNRGIQPQYVDGITEESTSSSVEIPGYSSAVDSDDPEKSDALYDEAVEFVTETRKISISSLQRRLRVGYNRSARLVEAMEAAGVVSEIQANGGREVLAPKPPSRD